MTRLGRGEVPGLIPAFLGLFLVRCLIIDDRGSNGRFGCDGSPMREVYGWGKVEAAYGFVM